jgi:RecJ-like exonuclease
LKTFCISHIKDVDGLGSAALVVAATGADVLLSNYDSITHDLDSIPPDVEQFVLCDLGADNADVDEFVSKMKKIASRASVTYIDHHFASETTKQRLRRAGVKLVYDELECAAILTYKTFKDALPERARMVALLGAVTDYMDDSPMASSIMEQADRHFILLEATMLAYAVARKGDEKGFPEMLVAELSRMKHPHEIPGVPGYALEQLRAVVRLGEEVKRKGRKIGKLAYMVTSEHSTGNVAKLLIGGFQVPVGVALREQKKGWYEVSLRCTSECGVHLGKTIARISSGLEGSGGGHKKAAGCRIPVRMMDEMIEQLSRAV